MEDVAIAPLDAAPPGSAPTELDPHPAVLAQSDPQGGARRTAEQAEVLVVELIAAHADALLRTARRYSLCADDAQDAYQRALEILMRHARRLDADRAAGWLHTVVKHEALAVNRQRSRMLGGPEVDLDAIEVRTAPSPEERVLGFEQVARSAEALQRLKPQEVRALWLKASGHSYQEICDATGWTYTKVNRCLAEGRKSFLARYAGIETGEECRRWAPVLSAMVDGEATAQQMLDLRPHLRNCAGCRAAVREMRSANAPLAALFPVGGLTLLAGDGPFAGAGDLLGRVWDALWGGLGDRAASIALRAQSVTGAIVPGRSAAVVASVAALAGSGFALDHAVVAPRTAPAAPAVTQAAGRTTPTVVDLVRPTGLPVRTTTTSARTKAKPARRARPRVRRPRARTVVQRTRPAAVPTPPRLSTASTARAASTPTATTARTTAPAVATPRPAAPAATPAAGRPAGEFGVETP
jgi:RNA polymerase sigma factor (sigma-70 family)